MNQKSLDEFFSMWGFKTAGDDMKEVVNHPKHYQGKGGMEAIDVIEGFELGFNLGNAIKYILRAKRKDDVIQDLRKAIWYIRREISRINEDMENEEDC